MYTKNLYTSLYSCASIYIYLYFIFELYSFVYTHICYLFIHLLDLFFFKQVFYSSLLHVLTSFHRLADALILRVKNCRERGTPTEKINIGVIN